MFNLLKKNILSLITALIILYLSLANANTFSEINDFGFPHLDKAVHFCMYFAFMIMLLYENKLSLKDKRNILFLSLIPFFYGILMECLQSWLTTTRSGDIIDAFVNLIGILIALIVWLLIQNFSKKTL